MSCSLITSEDVALLSMGCHFDPHRFLGVHGQQIRLWRPGAREVHIEVKGTIVPMERIDERGLFLYASNLSLSALDYRVYDQGARLAHDPYAFAPTLGALDAFLFNKGCHYELYRALGANIKRIQGVDGVQFAVWAPNAEGVALIADFNGFDGRQHPMRSLGPSGIWELFVPGVSAGEKYKFEIHAKGGYVRVKSDPFAFYSEMRPLTASVVAAFDRHMWEDGRWMQKRKGLDCNRPIQIYEVHLGSWKYFGSEFPNYRQVAIPLAAYCKEMGFTHVELLPIMEHPLDESWGYQVTGFFSVTSRYGTIADFQFFVDSLHKEGIGVILDWVPAHFPLDDYALNRFDGTALYEHEDPRKGIHPHWQTAIFNFGRNEVSNFLIASALYWIEQMHIDALRVDAVASMLYLDYGRKAGEWIPNPDGSNFNLEAIEFLKHLTHIVHERNPGVLMIAEESSSYQGVTDPQSLGFDLKWNMGWMNDTLRYFQRDPIYRKHHQNDLTFSLLYAFSERFCLSLSHDEMVHGKGSLVSKMPGPDWQKFASVRLLYSYMMGHPGKKLLFMGAEIAQWAEWDCKGTIHWTLLDSPYHRGMQAMVADLNHLSLKSPALWIRDFTWDGYQWVDFTDVEHSVLSYLRKADRQTLLFVHHFTPECYTGYRIALKGIKTIREIFNSDDEKYAGANQKNGRLFPTSEDVCITIAPLATMIFEVELEKDP